VTMKRAPEIVQAAPASKATQMRVSVVIPTKNRPSDLQRVIETLEQQTRRPAEIIVVDQSSQPPVIRSENPVRVVHDAAISGAAAARNVAMDLVSGDVCLFLDDDVELEPSFIEQLLAAYDLGVTGVSGIITNYTHPPLARRVWDWLFVRGPFHDERQDAYRKAEALRGRSPFPVHQFTGALMSFRDSVIREMRFDPNLTGASLAEDLDFCARLPEGSLLLMQPRARLVHKRSPLGRQGDHWLAAHAQSSTYMYQRHWRSKLRNRACFGWLKVGYAVVCSLSCLVGRGLSAWRAWQAGATKGRALGVKAPQDLLSNPRARGATGGQ
jgi:GT2 family glycosyltransferase